MFHKTYFKLLIGSEMTYKNTNIGEKPYKCITCDNHHITFKIMDFVNYSSLNMLKINGVISFGRQ